MCSTQNHKGCTSRPSPQRWAFACVIGAHLFIGVSCQWAGMGVYSPSPHRLCQPVYGGEESSTNPMGSIWNSTKVEWLNMAPG